MGDELKAQAIERYNARFREYGIDPRSLGWDTARHLLRLHILASQWDLTGATVLDFGCGLGDLYGLLRDRGIPVRYHGIDINPTLTQAAASRFPDAEFTVRDIESQGLDREYDFVFASGVFNWNDGRNEEFLRNAMGLLCSKCRRGLGLNFLTSHVDYRLDHLFYVDPGLLIRLAQTYTRRISLRHDYMPFEFSVFLDFDQRFEASCAVFPGFDAYLAKA
jgi:SAM-dependent methyltransferase